MPPNLEIALMNLSSANLILLEKKIREYGAERVKNLVFQQAEF